jgi:hypothetical protein
VDRRRTTREEELARIYHIAITTQPDLPVSYNIPPSQEVLRFGKTQKSSNVASIAYVGAARETAYAKIQVRVEGTRLAAQQLG